MTRSSETPPASDRPKVFCIGFHKTGTSSLGLALERLGYRVVGFRPFRDLALGRPVDIETVWTRARAIAENHDAAQDSPWPILYDRLDRTFPGAKFIHVVRDREAWLASALKDFGAQENAMRTLIYGAPCPAGHEDVWRARYDAHNAAVRDHFAGREGRDFLSLDLDRGEVGWAAICSFLGHPMPDAPWPHANTSRTKRVKLLWWRNRGRLERLLRARG